MASSWVIAADCEGRTRITDRAERLLVNGGEEMLPERAAAELLESDATGSSFPPSSMR